MSKQYKLVHVISSLARGGAEQILVTLCTELAHKHYTQTVLFFHDGPLRAELTRAGIPSIQITILSAYRTLRAIKPDMVHSSLWLANNVMRVICAYLKIPLVCALHNLREFDGLVRNILDRCIWHQPTAYCAVSHAVGAAHPERSRMGRPLIVIPNGIAQPRNFPKIITKNSFVIGAVGRFIPTKNYHALLTVFARMYKEHPQSRLILLGHGPQEHALRQHTAALHLTHVVTFIINKPAQHYYYLFDCFVHPSRSEGFGLTPVEATMHRVPTIVTPNPAELYKAITRHIQDPAYAQSTLQHGYARAVKDYSLEAMVTAYDRLFTRVAKR